VTGCEEEEEEEGEEERAGAGTSDVDVVARLDYFSVGAAQTRHHISRGRAAASRVMRSLEK
jgi:hypothetical protein